MIVTRWSQLSPRTKGLIITIAGSVSAAQVQRVKDWLIPQLANHPHVSTIMGGAFIIAGILVKPEVREMLGLKKQATAITDPVTGKVLEQSTTTSVVPLPTGTTGDGSITTVTSTKE